MLFTASDHRQVNNKQNNEPTQQDTGNETLKPCKSEWIQKNIFESIFSVSYKDAINEIVTSPIHNLFGKSPISEIAHFCESLHTFELTIKKSFAVLAAEPVNLMLSDDRENLFRRFHELRLSSDLRDMEVILQQANCPFPDNINNFLQVFMMELTSSLLKNFAHTMKNKSNEETETLSENDQKVLFYVSGFVIHALKKRYSKISEEQGRLQMLNVMDSMTAKQCDEDFLKKYRSFLEKKNRGSLQHPCDNFFLLLRSMEIVVRKSTSGKLSSHTLNKCALKEHIMENYMVKHYMEKLFPITETGDENDEFTKSPSSYLEDIISVFLTVRGFAIARVERNRIAKINKSTKQSTSNKAGNSFRHALKEKCINI